MNRENILKVADAIEANDTSGLQFDMSTGGRKNACGTAACIAGWAYSLSTNYDPGGVEWFGIYRTASQFLGLKCDEECDELFVPECCRLEEITPTQAASCLRHLAATGEVDWPRALAEVRP